MPRNGAGAYNLSDTLTAQTDATAEEVNAIFQDIADALSGSLAADGQKAPTGNLPMAGYVHTGVGNAAARTQYLSAAQAQDDAVCYGGTAGGTATALTCTLAPAISSYVSGGRLLVIAASDATAAAATIAVNGLATKAIKVWGADPLAKHWLAGDILDMRYDGTNYQLLNPRPVGFVPEGSGFTTGDYKPTSKTVADSGWAMMNDGTLGDGSSGGTMRANTDCQALFLLWWESYPNAPVSSGRGVSAAADWAAHKTIDAPKLKGRAWAVAGNGSGLTGRAMGDAVGAETHTLTASEMEHHHVLILVGDSPTGSGTPVAYASDTYGVALDSPTAHNNMQPTSFSMNVMVKL